MSSTVKTRLLFTEAPDRPVAHIAEALLDEGWTVPERGGQRLYSADGELWFDSTTDAVIQGLYSADTGYVFMERESLRLTLEYHIDDPDARNDRIATMELWSDEAMFEPPRGGWEAKNRDTSTQAYLDAVTTAVRELCPDYAYGAYPDEVPIERQATYDDVLDGRIRNVFWLTVFGPRHLRRFGRTRVESAPAWLVQPLGEDHIAVVAQDNPVQPSAEWAGAEETIAEHLGIDS